MKNRILAAAISSVLLISLTGCEAAPPSFQSPTSAPSVTAEKEEKAITNTSALTIQPTPFSSAVPVKDTDCQSDDAAPVASQKPVASASPIPLPENTHMPTATANPTITPTVVPTPSPMHTAAPSPTAQPTEKPKIWIVDVEGHFKTVKETITEQVWIEEQGHYEEKKIAITAPMYTCNHCDAVFYSQENVESHGWDEFENGNAGTYTYQGNAIVGYDTEQIWVIDTPGHYEDIVRSIEKEVWVNEVGHWE